MATENALIISQIPWKEIMNLVNNILIICACIGAFYKAFQWGEKSAANKYEGKISMLEKEKDLFSTKYEAQEALLNLESKKTELKNEEERKQYLIRAQDAEKTLNILKEKLSDSHTSVSKIEHFQDDLKLDINSIKLSELSTQSVNVSGAADVINNSKLAAIYQKGLDGNWTVTTWPVPY